MDQLRERLGPWPVWVWLALLTAVGLAWYLYAQHKKGATGAAAADASAAANTPEGFAQVPETVNQTTLNLTPPAAATPTPPPTTSPTQVPLNTTVAGKGKARVGSSQDLFFLAQDLGVTESQLIGWNPQLKSYYGTGKGIPSGTIINTGPPANTDPKKSTHPVTKLPTKAPTSKPGSTAKAA